MANQQQNPQFVHLKRSVAADMIEDMRKWIAQRVSAERIEVLLREKYGVQRLEKCEGESHSHIHGDSCSVCAPRWGFTGPTVKIR